MTDYLSLALCADEKNAVLEFSENGQRESHVMEASQGLSIADNIRMLIDELRRAAQNKHLASQFADCLQRGLAQALRPEMREPGHEE